MRLLPRLLGVQGHVFIRGRLRKGLIGDETEERLRVGMVFQSAAMFDSLTVAENVGFTLYEHSKLADDVIRCVAAMCLPIRHARC